MKKAKNQAAANKKMTQKKPLVLVRSIAAKAREKAGEHKKASPHRSFKLTRQSEIPRYGKVLSAWKLILRTAQLLIAEWKKTLGVVGIFVPLAWLISGVYSQDFSDLKFTLSALGDDVIGGVEEAVVLFTSFFKIQSEGIAQDSLVVLNILVILFWLSFIWIARYAVAKKETTIREALYTSGTSFVPFLLLTFLLLAQALPIAGAVLIFTSMSGTGFIQGVAETAVFSALGALLIILGLYFMVGTLVAAQIVALPGMYPWRALKNARKLVTGRRFAVLIKLIVLGLTIFITWAILFTPILLFDNTVCGDGESCWSTITVLPAVYYLLAALTIAFSSTYLYLMYRSLLETEE